MTSARSRVAIGVLGFVAVVAFVVAALFWLVLPIGCEDADDSAFNTVLCDSERGRGWQVVQAVLIGLSGLALVVGAVMAVRRGRFLPLVVPSIAAVPVFVAVLAIYDIELEDKPVPRVTDVRLLDASCSVPCGDGIRVSFVVDRPAEIELSIGPARYEDIGDRQYRSFIPGDDDAFAEVDSGSHELRVSGEILNPPSQRGPLPAGDYEVEVIARPQDAGNQEGLATDGVVRPVTITP